MKNLLRKLIRLFRGEQPGRDLVLLNLSFNSQNRIRPKGSFSTVNKEVPDTIVPNPPRITKEQEEEDRLERQKWTKSPAPEPIEGRTCHVCGGNLALVILNYYYEHGTDIITPADQAEKCLSCGRLTLLASRGAERGF